MLSSLSATHMGSCDSVVLGVNVEPDGNVFLLVRNRLTISWLELGHVAFMLSIDEGKADRSCIDLASTRVISRPP